MWRVILEHDPAVEDQRLVDEGFLSSPTARVDDPHLNGFACWLRDDRRRVRVGLLGRLRWCWLYVERLWLAPALRSQGHTPVALDDAIERGQLFCNILAARAGYRESG